MPSYPDLHWQRDSSSSSHSPSNNGKHRSCTDALTLIKLPQLGYAEDGWTIGSTIRRIEGVVNDDVEMQVRVEHLHMCIMLYAIT